MSSSPLENLERLALEQRNHLHDRTTELKSKVNEAREKLDPKRNVREHFVGIALFACAISLFSGYAVTGLFTRE